MAVEMRRKAGITLAACAALVLAGTAGAAWAYADDEGQPVGSWNEPADGPRTPVAAEQLAPGALPVDPALPAVPRTTVLAPEPTGTVTRHVPEAAVVPVGRQRVGELVQVRRLIKYAAGQRRVTFRYPGASYVKLHFNRLSMMPGEYLTVSSADGKEKYRYNAPDVLTTTPADRWAMSVTGDTAVLDVHKGAAKLPAAGPVLARLGVGVDRAARGFSRAEQRRQPERQIVASARSGREESVCGLDTSADAVCYKSADPVAYTKSKAIARLLINGTELCTGWRIGGKNRMITNNHCLTTSAEAYDTEVWFNYQCATCGGFKVFQPTKVWGDKVLATDHLYDYTLFTVDNFASIKKFGYLQLDTARPARGQELYVPQHPAGEPTRIAGSLGEKAGNCAVASAGYPGYAPTSDVSYYCDTEGGSSGSPVISRATDKVVALHHFGGCPNSGVRGDLLAAKLRRYL